MNAHGGSFIAALDTVAGCGAHFINSCPGSGASILPAANLPTSLAPDKNIAVLPLANLSEDKENAFFADGVQDELLANLSKIKDLKVISRTSVMQYKSGVPHNLKEIGRQLGVSNVVEGSVRGSGDHVPGFGAVDRRA